ncbi:polymerase [Mesorhizobium sp. CA8]|uniref:polymerase n=1 Tax=unclassified Mesorhizobium TaxID=325217 RepID=UPI001CCA1F0F|nr:MULTISPECIES: polymerase [unclassified Mesorhizobium]MBZ9764293.1 polymerase [Mesorhizobium sp. CA8]MBZ9822015.1 polymerase [Mesorhizobium sp. CA4]
MRLGEIIANTFAAMLLICGVALIFLVGGRPLFPRRQARVVVLLPADPDKTASIRDARQQLPGYFDVALAPRRPTALR